MKISPSHSNTLLDAVIVDTHPGLQPQAAVVWLHGLGADGHDFEPIVPALNMPSDIPTRFVFPHAPIQPVTINGGMHMRAWYDVYHLGSEIAVEVIDHGLKEDVEGIRASGLAVEAWLQALISQGIPPQSIVLTGFSQGGAIALYTGLRHPKALAGIIALSTYLPLAAHTVAETSPANIHIPIFMGHGTRDPIVPFTLGEASKRYLIDHNFPVDWREYPIQHTVSTPEIQDIGAWIAQRL